MSVCRALAIIALVISTSACRMPGDRSSATCNSAISGKVSTTCEGDSNNSTGTVNSPSSQTKKKYLYELQVPLGYVVNSSVAGWERKVMPGSDPVFSKYFEEGESFSFSGTHPCKAAIQFSAVADGDKSLIFAPGAALEFDFHPTGTWDYLSPSVGTKYRCGDSLQVEARRTGFPTQKISRSIAAATDVAFAISWWNPDVQVSPVAVPGSTFHEFDLAARSLLITAAADATIQCSLDNGLTYGSCSAVSYSPAQYSTNIPLKVKSTKAGSDSIFESTFPLQSIAPGRNFLTCTLSAEGSLNSGELDALKSTLPSGGVLCFKAGTVVSQIPASNGYIISGNNQVWIGDSLSRPRFLARDALASLRPIFDVQGLGFSLIHAYVESDSNTDIQFSVLSSRPAQSDLIQLVQFKNIDQNSNALSSGNYRRVILDQILVQSPRILSMGSSNTQAEFDIRNSRLESTKTLVVSQRAGKLTISDSVISSPSVSVEPLNIGAGSTLELIRSVIQSPFTGLTLGGTVKLASNTFKRVYSAANASSAAYAISTTVSTATINTAVSEGNTFCYLNSLATYTQPVNGPYQGTFVPSQQVNSGAIQACLQ